MLDTDTHTRKFSRLIFHNQSQPKRKLHMVLAQENLTKAFGKYKDDTFIFVQWSTSLGISIILCILYHLIIKKTQSLLHVGAEYGNSLGIRLSYRFKCVQISYRLTYNIYLKTGFISEEAAGHRPCSQCAGNNNSIHSSIFALRKCQRCSTSWWGI